MKFIDTHTHLYSEQFSEDRDAVISKAKESGVEHFFLPNIDSSSIAGMKELVKEYPLNCFPMMGLHPCSVNAEYEKELQIVRDELGNGKYIAVGEIGMDLYWDKSYLTQQKDAFRKQIQMAKDRQLPIVIHCRDAFDEILNILDEENDDDLSGIFHCFTGNLEQAKHILSYGDFKLGIGGVATFKNADLDTVLKQLKLNDLVLETDSPYLAPVPYRGKRNESAYVKIVAEKLAEIYELPLAEIAQRTTDNAHQIFNIHGQSF